MFLFFDRFDTLSDDILTLRLMEKNQGSDVRLPFYYYDIYDNKSGSLMGKISVRIGHNFHSYYNGHVGYEIDETYRGHRYSYYAVRLVLRVALAHGMDYLFITCKKSNEASKKIIEKIGARLIETVPIPKECFFWREGLEESCIYRLDLK